MSVITDLNPTVLKLSKQVLAGTATRDTIVSGRCSGGALTRGIGFTFSDLTEGRPAWLTITEPFSITLYWSYQSNGDWQKASMYPMTDLYLDRFYTVYDVQPGISFSVKGVAGFAFGGGADSDRGMLMTFTELP